MHSTLTEAETWILSDIRRHVIAKGYREQEGVNLFVPHHVAAALATARVLISQYERFVAVAPEGHTYGYFFEKLGGRVSSVFVDYPPTRCVPVDDPEALRGKRVLVIEDDVSSGRTLQLIMRCLLAFAPTTVDLFLGHSRGIQHLQNVPPSIGQVHLADIGNGRALERLEAELIEFVDRLRNA